MRVALLMLRQRPAAAVATYLALWFAVAMVTACGVMLESGIRYHGTVQRHAGSTVLVATTDLSVSSGSGEDRSLERYPISRTGAGRHVACQSNRAVAGRASGRRRRRGAGTAGDRRWVAGLRGVHSSVVGGGVDAVHAAGRGSADHEWGSSGRRAARRDGQGEARPTDPDRCRIRARGHSGSVASRRLLDPPWTRARSSSTIPRPRRWPVILAGLR